MNTPADNQPLLPIVVPAYDEKAAMSEVMAAEAFTSEQNVRRHLRTHRICSPPDYRQLAERGFSARNIHSIVDCFLLLSRQTRSSSASYRFSPVRCNLLTTVDPVDYTLLQWIATRKLVVSFTLKQNEGFGYAYPTSKTSRALLW